MTGCKLHRGFVRQRLMQQPALAHSRIMQSHHRQGSALAASDGHSIIVSGSEDILLRCPALAGLPSCHSHLFTGPQRCGAVRTSRGISRHRLSSTTSPRMPTSANAALLQHRDAEQHQGCTWSVGVTTWGVDDSIVRIHSLEYTTSRNGHSLTEAVSMQLVQTPIPS